MTPSVTNLKAKIAAYMNRAASSFVIGGVDNLLEAMNDARRNAQLRYDFNHLRVRAFLVVTPTGVNWQTDATDSPGGTAVPLKSIKEVWSFETVSGLPTKYKQMFFEGGVLNDFEVITPSLQIVGSQLLPNNLNITSSETYLIEGIKWLPELDGTETNDFFCNRGATWLTYQTIQNLNLYLKEDSRVGISDAVVQRAWSDFISWDGNLGLSNNATRLN